jgi:mannose-6-phosphate isomerase class I
MALAVTPFEAMCGFRPIAELTNFLTTVPGKFIDTIALSPSVVAVALIPSFKISMRDNDNDI